MRGMMNNPKMREQEQAYLITAEDITEAMQDLVSRTEIGFFVAGEPTVHKIEDHYYDTPDNDLRQSKVTLRKRILDCETLITLKGIEQQGKNMTQDHNEWEFVWPFDLDLASPEMLFAVSGLEEVQVRNTTRVARPITFHQEENDAVTLIPVATMAIDSSLYSVSTGQAKMYEVEFELDPNSPFKMKQLRKAVEETFDYLQPWDHGKFITGKAIEFAFGVTTNDDGVINLGSFDFIEDMFEQLTVVQGIKKLKIAK